MTPECKVGDNLLGRLIQLEKNSGRGSSPRNFAIFTKILLKAGCHTHSLTRYLYSRRLEISESRRSAEAREERVLHVFRGGVMVLAPFGKNFWKALMRGDDETNSSDDRETVKESTGRREEYNRHEPESTGGSLPSAEHDQPHRSADRDEHGSTQPEPRRREEGRREETRRDDEGWRVGGDRDERPRRSERASDESSSEGYTGEPTERRGRSSAEQEDEPSGNRAGGEGEEGETSERQPRQGRGPRGPIPRGRRGRGRDENRGGSRYGGSRDGGGRGGRGPRRNTSEDRPPEDEDQNDEELLDSDLEDENGERRSGEDHVEHDDPLGGAFDLERGTPISTYSVQDSPPVQARAKMKAPKEFFNTEIVYRYDILEDSDRDALRGRYRLELKGYQGGVWTVLIDDALEVVNRREDAEIVLTMQQRDFLHLVNGQLNPQLALFAQKVRITGDLKRALAFQAILVPSSDY